MSKEPKKKSKAGLIIGIVVGVILLLFVLLLLTGDDEETVSEADSVSTESSYDEETEEALFDDEEYSETETEVTGASLGDSDAYPRGTCDRLEGTTVVVSIFADDDTSGWDFTKDADLKLYNDMASYMRKGLDWLEAQAADYGKDVKFVSDFMADEDLFYTVKLDCNFGDGNSHIDTVKPFLEENMDEIGIKLLQKYNADNILFAIFLNQPEDTPMTSYAHPYYGTHRGFDMPFEAVVLSSYVYGAQQGPAMYAHEVLHLFGAPDFYLPDTDGGNFGISQEFVDYCEANHKNEIMYSNYDIYNNCVDFEKVTNDLTDLTAYYLGWVDKCQDCIDFGMTEREEK